METREKKTRMATESPTPASTGNSTTPSEVTPNTPTRARRSRASVESAKPIATNSATSTTNTATAAPTTSSSTDSVTNASDAKVKSDPDSKAKSETTSDEKTTGRKLYKRKVYTPERKIGTRSLDGAKRSVIMKRRSLPDIKSRMNLPNNRRSSTGKIQLVKKQIKEIVEENNSTASGASDSAKKARSRQSVKKESTETSPPVRRKRLLTPDAGADEKSVGDGKGEKQIKLEVSETTTEKKDEKTERRDSNASKSSETPMIVDTPAINKDDNEKVKDTVKEPEKLKEKEPEKDEIEEKEITKITEEIKTEKEDPTEVVPEGKETKTSEEGSSTDKRPVRRSGRPRRSILSDRPATPKQNGKDAKDTVEKSSTPTPDEIAPVQSALTPITANVDELPTTDGAVVKASSLSPKGDEIVSEMSVKQFYGKAEFRENNLGIEKDPKLGKIVQDTVEIQPEAKKDQQTEEQVEKEVEKVEDKDEEKEKKPESVEEKPVEEKVCDDKSEMIQVPVEVAVSVEMEIEKSEDKGNEKETEEIKIKEVKEDVKIEKIETKQEDVVMESSTTVEPMVTEETDKLDDSKSPQVNKGNETEIKETQKDEVKACEQQDDNVDNDKNSKDKKETEKGKKQEGNKPVEKSKSVEKVTKVVDRAAKNVDKTAKVEKTTKAVEKPTKVTEKSSKGAKNTKTVEKQTKAVEKVTKVEEKPVKVEEKPAKVEEKPAKVTETVETKPIQKVPEEAITKPLANLIPELDKGDDEEDKIEALVPEKIIVKIPDVKKQKEEEKKKAAALKKVEKVEKQPTPPPIITPPQPQKVEKAVPKKEEIPAKVERIPPPPPKVEETIHRTLHDLESSLPLSCISKIQTEIESPETIKQKESHLKSLGLITIQAADEAKNEENLRRKERIRNSISNESASSSASSTTSRGNKSNGTKGSKSKNGGNKEYTGTLKTVIKINRQQNPPQQQQQIQKTISTTITSSTTTASSASSVSSSNANKKRLPLKMTFQKGRSENDGDANATGNEETTFYTIQPEKEPVGEHHESEREKSEEIVIPEKASSFKFHPGRLCQDQCHYCGGKFGLFDTPCHVAQIKSLDRQKKILDNESKLTVDSCLCDACYRHVDRKANCPSYKKRLSAPATTSSTMTTDSNTSLTGLTQTQQQNQLIHHQLCHVVNCPNVGIHSIRRKWLIRMKKSINKLIHLNVDTAMNNGQAMVPICDSHYDAISHLMICTLCKRKLTRNHIFYITQVSGLLFNYFYGFFA